MRRWLAVLALGLGLGFPLQAFAQSGVCAVQGKGLEPVAFETLTVSTVALPLTAATINTTTAAAAFLTLEGAAIRFTLFGVPSATVGHLVDPPAGGASATGSGTWICGRAALLGFRAIRSGGTDGTLRVSYFKQRQ